MVLDIEVVVEVGGFGGHDEGLDWLVEIDRERTYFAAGVDADDAQEKDSGFRGVETENELRFGLRRACHGG